MGIDVRFVDLMPDIPMDDDGNVLEIYADAVATLKGHGQNVTTTYCVFGRVIGSQILQRIPVVKIVRPLASLLDLAKLLAAAGEIVSGDMRMH